DERRQRPQGQEGGREGRVGRFRCQNDGRGDAREREASGKLQCEALEIGSPVVIAARERHPFEHVAAADEKTEHGAHDGIERKPGWTRKEGEDEEYLRK